MKRMFRPSRTLPLPSDAIEKAAVSGPLAEGVRPAASFSDWLSVLFISRGHYNITGKAVESLGGPRGSLPQRRSRAGRVVGNLIAREGAESVFRRGLAVRRPHLDWQDPSVRAAAVKGLVRFLGKEPGQLEFDDMRNNGLSGLTRRYGSSPYLALVEAGYAHSRGEVLHHAATGRFDSGKLYPWELVRAGNSLYADAGIRSAAVRWLLWRTGKGVREITCDDFALNSLAGLLDNRFNGSPHKALSGAGMAYGRDEATAHASSGRFRSDKPYPWEMYNARIYHDKPMRAAATRWLLWTTGKKPAELAQEDFSQNGLGGLIQLPSYNGSPYAALVESGLAYSRKETLAHSASGAFGQERIYPWEMNNIRIYSGKPMRRAAIRWLVWLCAKEPQDVTGVDFSGAGLAGLLSNHYGGSPFRALLDAGCVTPAEEPYMRRHGGARFA